MFGSLAEVEGTNLLSTAAFALPNQFVKQALMHYIASSLIVWSHDEILFVDTTGIGR